VTIIIVNRYQRVQTQKPSSRTEVILHFGRIMTSCCRFGVINRKNCEHKQDWKDLLQEGRRKKNCLPKKCKVCCRQNKIQYVVTGCGVWFFIRVPVSRGIYPHTPPPKKSRKLWQSAGILKPCVLCKQSSIFSISTAFQGQQLQGYCNSGIYISGTVVTQGVTNQYQKPVTNARLVWILISFFFTFLCFWFRIIFPSCDSS